MHNVRTDPLRATRAQASNEYARPQRRSVVRLLAAAVLAAQVSFASADTTPYNKGVEAWRKQDYAQAAKQWSASVLSGDANAMNNLAYLYFNGMGTERRTVDAVALWRVAAYAGQSESQWHLGYAYEQGIGVDKDLVAAYAWYGCAVETARRLGVKDDSGAEAKIAEDAKSSLTALEGQLAPAARASALALRDKLIPRYSAAVP